MSTHAAGPGAGEQRRRLISKWHAQAHDVLDDYGIPRAADGLNYTLAERIERLAGRPPEPRQQEPIQPAPTDGKSA